MEGPNSEPLRALIVDDQRDFIYVMTQLLERLGCNVTACQDGEDCITEARRTRPRLILVQFLSPENRLFDCT